MEIDIDISSSPSPCHVKGVKKIKLDRSLEDKNNATDSEPSTTCASRRVEKLEEYNFPATDPEAFRKEGKFNTVGEIMEILNSTNTHKRDHMATAEMCQEIKRPRLTTNKGNIKALYGFDIDHHTYLHPEEALYLVETGKLEIFTEAVPMSIERARHLFLESSQIPSCSATDYIVYKHFAKLGYRVQRRCPEYLSSCPTEEPAVSLENPMDTDCIMNPQDVDVELSFRGTKRRAEFSHLDVDVADADVRCESDVTAKGHKPLDVIIEDDSDCEFIEEVEKQSVRVTVSEEDEMIHEEVTMDEAFLPTSESHKWEGAGACCPPSPSSPLPYSVAESDSDVEFVDEVSHCGVFIQEVTSDESISYLDEAGPSSSKPPEVLVDLVSSDSEDETSEFYQPIWSKCVPNSKIQFSFPPSDFLPDNIHPRPARTVYEVNLNRLYADADTETEIETIVDRVRLGVNLEQGSSCADSIGNSWKEWRENEKAEAMQILNDSLVGKGLIDNDEGWQSIKRLKSSNLYHWKLETPNSGHDVSDKKVLRVPYDLYAQSAAHVHRNKLGVIVKPIHRIAVVRESEVVPCASQLPSSDEEPPLLVTVVGEDSSIIQLLCNSQPIQSLF